MREEVRARAVTLEIEARQHAPADAINRLAVYAAQLERALADTRRELAELHQRLAGWSPLVEYVPPPGIHGPVG
jgi:hypothetical protein